jgi:hypothetical protein
MVYFSKYFSLKVKKDMPRMVDHSCNPSYSGGKDQEDHCLKPAWAKSQPGVVVHTCYPSFREGVNRVAVQTSPRQKCESLSKK